MNRPNIKSTRKVIPMIYAYTTPGISYHDGYIKIGYTEQNVDDRIRQQTHTAGIKPKKEWQGNATFDDGSGEVFTDKQFHLYLRKNGIKQPQEEDNEYFDKNDENEWFHVSPQKSRNLFNEFRSNKGVIDKDLHEISLYKLRDEQLEAVNKTIMYRKKHEGGQFLWNAKPRFGKTLSVYDFVKKMKAKKVLIVTNRPAIANSWYSDYEKFMGRESGLFFVSNVDGIKDKPLVIDYDTYKKDKESRKKDFNNVKMGLIEFVSLQDLKGSIHFSDSENAINKLKEVKNIRWDLLVIDEAHEGVDTYKTDIAFEQIRRDFTLHLSGTPFKALASNKFSDDEIFNWTYADEQNKKNEWDESKQEENPYANLPKLNLYTYKMSEIIKDEIKKGIEINGETEEYAFDLNEFFAVENDAFKYNDSVDKFLDALTFQEKYPFSTQELREELKHTFWLLDRVESAKLLAKKLKSHPIFQEYKVIVAAGDGKTDDEKDEEIINSYDKVVKSIKEYDKTITLSVGQLTTGITIPEWTAVLMLSNIKSPSLYMQAAFRAQNPCLFKEGVESWRKENAYVFDFDPARTLDIFEQFANNLNPSTAIGNGNVEQRKKNIRMLLNFFPVIGEDEEGKLIELNATEVLSIPRKIRSVEVVKRGFMSNFLFQNISCMFSAPKEVIDIIKKFEPVDEPKKKRKLPSDVKENLYINRYGEVELPEEYIDNKSKDIFGKKIFDNSLQEVKETLDTIVEKPDAVKSTVNELTKFIKAKNEEVVNIADNSYGKDLKQKKQIESRLNTEAKRSIDKAYSNYKIENRTLEAQFVSEKKQRYKSGKSVEQIQKEFNEKKKDSLCKFKDEMEKIVQKNTENSMKTVVETVEKNKKERLKAGIEDGIKDHIRGFSRTIPSFLMAYGNNSMTLATFSDNIPDDVFKEVTSITIDQFKILRDGGDYRDEQTGEMKHFEGHLFDEVVFNDSIQEFLSLKNKLSNYFDENSQEDIFDYIPPQKTNQIYTPRTIVVQMVDLLEKENPGCFDNKDKTFVDLYMKSGLYITEIVKRLYRSEKIKEQIPNNKDRLKHIFEKQMYGLAPTEIIYKIATNYILGFMSDTDDIKHNFRQVDALPYAKDGTLQQKLDEIFE